MRHLADFFHSRAIEMARGGSLTWWEGVLDHRIWNSEATDSDGTVTADSAKTVTTDSAKYGNATSITDNENEDPSDPQEHGDMTYQCDSSLGGAPEPIDCEKLLWSGLKPPDSVETLQAHVPKIYSQGKSYPFLPYALPRSKSLSAIKPLSSDDFI